MDEKLIIECDYAKAQVLQEALSAKNITCRVIDENGVLSIMSTGGNLPMVKVLVPDSDFEKAVDVVKPLLDANDTGLSWCPKCGSEDITKKTLTKKHGNIWLLVSSILIIVTGCVLAFVFKFILGFIFWIACIFLLYGYFHPVKEEYICNKCGHKFTHM